MGKKKNGLKNRWFGRKNSKSPKKDGTKTFEEKRIDLTFNVVLQDNFMITFD
jgi:hypothetical protein